MVMSGTEQIFGQRKMLEKLTFCAQCDKEILQEFSKKHIGIRRYYMSLWLYIFGRMRFFFFFNLFEQTYFGRGIVLVLKDKIYDGHWG